MLVAASHCGFGDVIPGGLGVTVFFFLSGYLITTLLEREFAFSGTISFRRFFARRVARLAPAFLVTLAMADTLVHFGLLSGKVTWTGSLAQIFYFANYYSVFFGGSQYIAGGTATYWSLSVEEHFYLLYPFLVSFLLFRRDKKYRAIFFLCATSIVFCWRIYLASKGSVNSDRIYYLTDTRVDSILWGCFFATAVPQLSSHQIDVSYRKTIVLLTSGIGLILLSLVIRNQFFRDTFRYTLQGVALIPIFYSLLCAPNTGIHKLLNSPLMSNLGKLSYGFYLNHLIIITFLTEHTGLGSHHFLLFIAAASLAFIIAWIITKNIEYPFRRWNAVATRVASMPVTV
ncbi:MAG: acyltransferase [Candidatus Eremiobacteraeota bacterium]|nr:acyltransferase [Candidatus Eremiobacteraeota bacterium]